MMALLYECTTFSAIDCSAAVAGGTMVTFPGSGLRVQVGRHLLDSRHHPGSGPDDSRLENVDPAGRDRRNLRPCRIACQ